MAQNVQDTMELNIYGAICIERNRKDCYRGRITVKISGDERIALCAAFCIGREGRVILT